MAVCWYSKGERGWGSTFNRFVDHTSHRSLANKAWLLAYIYIAGCFIVTSVVLFPGQLRGKTKQNTTNSKVVIPVVPWFLWSSTRSLHCILRSTQVLPIYGCWRQWQYWAYPYQGVAPVGEALPQRQGYKRALETQRK